MTDAQWESDQRPAPDFSRFRLRDNSPEAVKTLTTIFTRAFDPRPAYRFDSAMTFITELASCSPHWRSANVVPGPLTTSQQVQTVDDLSVPPNPWATGAQPVVGGNPWAQPPSQPMPVMSPNYTQILPEGSTAVSVAAPEAGPAKRRGSWATVTVLGVLCAVAAAGVGYLGFFAAVHGKWEDPEAAIAATLPDAVPKWENAKGPVETTCVKGRSGEGLASIDCTGDTVNFTFTDFGTADLRDDAAPGGQTTEWPGTTCTIASQKIGEDSYFVMPDVAGGRFGITVTGQDAESIQSRLKLC